MRLLILICGLIIYTGVFAHILKPNANGAEKSENNSDNNQSISVTLPPSLNHNVSGKLETAPSQHKPEGDNDSAKLTDVLLTIFNGMLVAVTVGLVVYNRRLWVSTEKLVIGADDTARKQLRAYVNGSIGRCVWKFSQGKNEFTDFEINIRWENAGVTPALDCTSGSGVAVNMAPTFPTNENGDNIIFTIGPKAPINSPPINITLQELQSAFDKKIRIFIWGIIKYRDVFLLEKDPPRHTEICFEVIVEVNPGLIPITDKTVIPDIINFRGIREHNSTT